MDLSESDEEFVEKALAIVASDSDVDEDLVEASAESLAEIWARRNRLTSEDIVRLHPVGQRIALATLQSLNPALAAQAERMLGR
jgi:hypothetical protein